MDLNAYQQAALRTAKMFPTRTENFNHAKIGLITELGEFATVVKRVDIYGKPLDEAMRLHAIEELGDALWYVSLGAHELGFTLAGVMVLLKPQDRVHDAKMSLDDVVSTMSLLVSAVSASAMQMKAGVDVAIVDVGRVLCSIVDCIDVAAEILGTTVEDICEMNIAKLRLRFPEKYSDIAAEARVDKEGADARVS